MRAVIFMAVLAALAGSALAQQKAGDLTIGQPWARATAPTAQAGAVYLSVTNGGAAADRLIGVSSEIASMSHLHESTQDANGVMTMDAMKDGVPVPPGGTVTFKPGGLHVMLMGLKKPLNVGDSVPLTLTFEKAGAVKVTAEVAAAGAAGPPAH